VEQVLIADLQDAGWRMVPPAVHDALCRVRVATLQESGPYPGFLHCVFCGFFYARQTTPGAEVRA
jgi:hypothetical protein